MKKNCVICILILFLGSSCLKINAQVISLDSILTAVETNYPMLKMYDEKIKALNANAEGAKSWMPPQFGVGLFMTPYNFQKDMGAVMLSGEQMIPNPVKLSANKKYMQSMSAVESDSKSYSKNQMFGMAKMIYYDWVVMKMKKLVLTRNEELLNFTIASAENRYPYGKEKLNNIYKAKAQLYEVYNMQLMLDKDISQMRIALNTLLNVDKNTTFDVDTNFIIQNYDVSLVDISSFKSFRSDIKLAESQISMMQYKQQLEKNARLPDFGIRYDHMNTLGKSSNLFSIMGMITIPIAPWSSGMYKANVKGLGFEIQSKQFLKVDIVNEAAGKLEDLRIQIKFKKQQLILYSDSILPALKNNYQITIIAYDQNTDDLFMVLDAWQMLNMKELEYYDRVGELLQLQVGYEKEIEKR